MKQLPLKTIGATAVSLLVASAFFVSSKTVAQSTTSAYSGVCAGIFNLGNAYEVALKNPSTYDDESINASIIIDFSTNKMSLAVNEISTVNGARSYKLKVVTNKDMVLTDFASMPGTKKAVVTSPDLGGAVEVLIIPVNSGNTLLIQGLSFGSSGICQKV